MNLKQLTLLILLSIIFSIYQTNAQVERENNTPLTLPECIKIALQNNKQILSASESIRGAKAKVDESRSGYYPQLRLESNYQRLNTFSKFKLDIPDMPMDEIKLGTADNYSAQVSVYQSLFNWRRDSKSIDMSELELAMSKTNVSLTKQEVTFVVVQLFYKILMIQQSIPIIDDNLKLLEQRLAMMKKKYDGGETSDFDLLSVDVQISSVKGQKLDAEINLKKLELEFNKIIGRSINATVQLTDSPSDKIIHMDQDALCRQAFANRNELKLIQSKEQMAQLQGEIVSTANKPNLGAYFNWDIRNGYLPKVDQFKGSWNTGVTLSFPLFDGFRTSAQVSQAEVNRNAAQIELENAKQSIHVEVERAILDLKLAEKKIEIEKLKINQSEQALKIAEEKHDKGLMNTLDLLETQQTLESARLNYIEVIHSYNVSRYNVNRVIGTEF